MKSMGVAPAWRAAIWAILVSASCALGCGGDDKPPGGAAPTTDAGDAGDSGDAGTDTGIEDAGTDGDVDQPDAGDGGDGGPTCSDECTIGEKACDGTTGYKVCGQFDSDSCAELSGAVACAQGYQCEGTRCVSGCRNECPAGSTICLDETTLQTCGNFDGDACREPGGGVACDSGQRCESGACVPTTQACSDECTQTGETVCFGDAVRTCGQHDSDTCLDLGAPVACALGEMCSAGACVAFCADECSTDGATQCVGNGVSTCGDANADGCLEWSPVVACGAGESCSAGACSATCSDDCSAAGSLVCAADGSGVAVCGEYDGDPCLDLASPLPCPLGYACSGGVCLASCVNDCASGAKRCGSNGTSLETCGDYDEDPCTEWGGQVACPGSAACSAGACDVPCSDDCTPDGQKACVSGQNATQTCGQYDLDSCLEWSSASSCETWQACNAGVCELGTTPATVLVNEVVYDSVGTDTSPGTTVFVELWGPQGQSLDGYAVVGIDGNDGNEYNRISLDGQSIGSDGYFVIAHPSAAAPLAAVTDIFRSQADYQNGPDSIQVQWRGRVVDAIGYGTFGAGTTFAGEGTPTATTAAGESLTRDASHTDTDDNSADFLVSSQPSPREGSITCTEECSSTGQTQCFGTQIQTCGNYDTDTCLEWSSPQNCPNAGDVCNGGACGSSCSDECTSSGQTQCSGAQIQTCGDYDGDPCLEWSAAQDCPTAGETCQGTTCQAPCNNECPQNGDTQCSGDQVQTCGNYDADSCLEWSTAAACNSGERCVVDACQSTQAPEVVLISPQGTVQTTQGNTHRILVDATAAAGRTIANVKYYADGALLGSTTATPHEFFYTVPASTPTGSTIQIQATATDNIGDTGVSPYAYLDVQNDTPVAAFTATITNTSTVTVDASAVTDTETPTANLEVCWDWNNDGTCETPFSTNKVETHDYGASGDYTVRMVVRDAVGQTAETTRDVSFADIRYIGGQDVTTTLWYGTIIITGEVRVPAGETLSIAPGTQVLFVWSDVGSDGVGDYTLTIEGTLDVQGTAADPVVFSGQDTTAKVPGGWDRILLNGSTPSTITHAIVEYADVGFEVHNASVFDSVTVRQTKQECIRLDNADNASLTDVTVTECGTDGVYALNGSTGVNALRLTATVNGDDGVEITGSSAVTIATSTLSGNTADGGEAGVGSTLDVADSVLENNGERGLLYVGNANGAVGNNQLRQNGAEGLGLLSTNSGHPSPVVQYNNIYSNATTGSTLQTQIDPSATLTASGAYSGTSATYTAPAGTVIRRAFASFDGSSYGSYDYGYLEDGSGTAIRTYSSTSSGWVYIPEGTTTLRVRVYDSTYNDVETMMVTGLELVDLTGAHDVVAITDSGTADLRANYLGTFPNVLSRVSMSRNAALDLQGFVGVAFDDTWSTGPYVGGFDLPTTTWSGTIYVTGNVSVPVGEVLTVDPGTQVQFVNHDQDADGEGDFSITAYGSMNLNGAVGSEVVVTGYGTPSGDVFQTITLADSNSLWQNVTMEYGKVPLTIRGGSTVQDTSIAGGSSHGVYIPEGTGATLVNVTVDGAGADGVNIDTAQSTLLSYLTTRNNGGSGVYVRGGATPTIEDSTIRDNGLHGIWSSGASPTVNYDIITYNGGAGVWADSGGSPTGEYNVIKFNDDSGVAVWSTASGHATPTIQYSNIYGNAVVGSTKDREIDTATTLTITGAYSGTSSIWTAPAGTKIRRVHASFDGGSYGSYDYGYLEDGSGNVLRTYSSTSSGWVYIPEGTTSLRVRVYDSTYNDPETMTVNTVEVIELDTSSNYELVAITESGTTTAKFNYWTPNIGEVATKIYQKRAGSVDYTGFTGAEYTTAGPRP